MKKLRIFLIFVLPLILILSNTNTQAQNVFYVEASTTYLLPTNFDPLPAGGDTIKIMADRSESLKFKSFEGSENSPIVFINEGGQVHINTQEWGALTFEDCKYIKVSGQGDPSFHYGFKLQGKVSCLSFLEYSTDCEAENIELQGNGTTFFGIYAKKDFSGFPPEPYPIFKNLSIHDTYIHDLAEGMYIGETTSPGMEFHHLRVYNNVVINTLRESVQIANSVDDVEIYNNFFLNAGLENLLYQQNGLQIGNNTIAKVYNNIIINAPANGIIILGNGDISANNNFISQTSGIFIDNRFDIIPYSPISIEGNFFDQVTSTQIIENMNEYNDLIFRDNDYNTNITFFNNKVESLGLVVVENNQLGTIADFQYTIENGIFHNSTENPILYQSMGPQNGLSHVFNDSPVLQPIDDILIEYSTNIIINLNATVGDQDILHFEGRDLPAFVQINELSSGAAELIINPLFEDIGVYEIGILVYDESHHAYDRQVVHLSVKTSENQAPILSFETNIAIEAASKFQFDITAFDANNDELFYSASSLPGFAKIVTINDKVFLDLQPKISDIGLYILDIVADDGYGIPATRQLTLDITQTDLTSGRIIYRVNFGGPEIEDEPLNWEADLDNSIAVYSTTYFLRTGSWTWSGVNNTSAPNNLFGPFRYDVADGTEMQFAFPLSANGRYKVKLFFAERSTEVLANLTGTFNIFLENTKVLDNFNIYQTSQYEALEQSFEILVADGIINLDFQQIENKSKINGIEISYLGDIVENLAPEIETITPIILSENEVLEIPIVILDDDFELCNSINLTALNAPDFLTITQNIDGEFSILLQPDFEDSGVYESTILLASDGCSDNTQAISITVLNTNRLPVFESIESIELQAGSTININILANDADADMLYLQMINAPDFVQFNDLGNGDGTLYFAPSISDAGNFIFEIIADDGHGETVSTIINLQVIAAPISERIVLNTSMVTDLVEGGSRNTPLYLVNEQDKDPFLNQHPKSKSWIPSKNIVGSPFLTIIDLNEEYFIDFALLHDMQYADDLHFSVGTPDNWTEISTYNTSAYKQWAEVSLKSNSRYLLLSMYNTIYAQINELALYGYALNPSFKLNTSETNDVNSTKFEIYPNPAKNRIYFKNKSENQTVEIIDVNGRVVLRTQENLVEISQLPNGIYLLRLHDQNQVIFKSRFIKNK